MEGDGNSGIGEHSAFPHSYKIDKTLYIVIDKKK